MSLIDAAMNGSRGEDQRRIAQVGLQWIETILRKNHDYGGSVWKTPKLAPHCSMADAIMVRMTDKVERIECLRRRGDSEVQESLDDTIGDLGSYCLLYLARPLDDCDFDCDLACIKTECDVADIRSIS